MKNILLGIIAILFSFNGWAESNVCEVAQIKRWGTDERNSEMMNLYVDMLENCKDGQNLWMQDAGIFQHLFVLSYCDLDSSIYVKEPYLRTKPSNLLICVFKNHGNGQNLKERFSPE